MKRVIKNIHFNIFEILFLLLITCIIFYSFASKYISVYFRYIDDLYVIIFMLLSLLKYRKKKYNLNKYDKNLFLLGVALVIVGLIGNCISKYQDSIMSILLDILSFCKLFGIYFFGIILFDSKSGNRYFYITEKYVKVILIIILSIAVGNILFDWNLASKYNRYGLIAYSIGGHPTFAAAVCCFCISILLVNYSENKKWVFLGFLLSFLTLRTKAIAYVVLMVIFLFFNKGKKDVQVKKFIFYGLIAVIIAWKYIVGYFFDLTASRGLAMKSSFILAGKFFPFGSGFGTFGTPASILNYSFAYIDLGLEHRYGFMENAGSFVGDGGWATQIGQFGILGTSIFVFMILMLYNSVRYYASKTLNCASYISIFFYLLICSTSETSISSNYAVLLAIVLVLVTKKGQYMDEIRKKKE